MTTRTRLAALGLAIGTLWGCLDDPTPDTIRLRINNPANDGVRVIFSTNFVAGQAPDEGTFQVRVLLSDTIETSSPIDTVISILPDRIFFVQAAPVSSDSLSVSVRIDADRRNLFEDTGLIFLNDPWNFVYLYNRNLATSTVQVVL